MKSIRILVAVAARERHEEILAEVPHGSTLQEGMALLVDRIKSLIHDGQAGAIGVWGKVRPSHYLLREGDRIEIYRPLKADPKQARRTRVTGKLKR